MEDNENDIMEDINDMANDVIISPEAITKMALEVKTYLFQNYEHGRLDEVSSKLSRFTPDYHPDIHDRIAADWLFVLNTMNFALWNPKNAKQWTVNQLTGYQALCAAIKRAIDRKMPIWNPKYYTKLTQDKLEIIFKSDDGETSIPLIHERLRILHEVGNVLLIKYKGTFKQCILLCKRDPLKLYSIVVTEFESYQEKLTYENKEVYLSSKADTLVSDIWFCYKGHRVFGFDYDPHLMKTSMFADYRVSQVFLHFKVLNYSKELMTKLKNNEPLEYDSKENVEIRCVSYYAMKVLSDIMKEMCQDFKNITLDNYVILIDNFLWDYRHVHDQLLMETQPFPNIKCIYY